MYDGIPSLQHLSTSLASMFVYDEGSMRSTNQSASGISHSQNVILETCNVESESKKKKKMADYFVFSRIINNKVSLNSQHILSFLECRSSCNF